MEFALPELLTREEILHILHGRQLKMLDLESLPYDELLRIYKTFVVPLAKRENNCTKRCVVHCQRAQKRPINVPVEAETPCPKIINAALSLQIECTMQTQRKSLLIGEKRAYPQDQHPQPLKECSISIATKRIKINWP